MNWNRATAALILCGPPSLILFSMLIAAGCAAHRPVTVAPKRLVLPLACMADVQVNAAECRDIGNGLAECNHVRATVVCLKAANPMGEQK